MSLAQVAGWGTTLAALGGLVAVPLYIEAREDQRARDIISQDPVKALLDPPSAELVGESICRLLHTDSMRSLALAQIPEVTVHKIAGDSFKSDSDGIWFYRDKASLLAYGRLTPEAVVTIFTETHPNMEVTGVFPIEFRDQVVHKTGIHRIDGVPEALMFTVKVK